MGEQKKPRFKPGDVICYKARILVNGESDPPEVIDENWYYLVLNEMVKTYRLQRFFFGQASLYTTTLDCKAADEQSELIGHIDLSLIENASMNI